MIIYRNKEFKIIKSERGYVVINENGEYKNHSHFNYSLEASKKCIRMVQKNKIPKYSLYMMVACKRLSIDEKYIQAIDNLLKRYTERNHKTVRRHR